MAIQAHVRTAVAFAFVLVVLTGALALGEWAWKAPFTMSIEVIDGPKHLVVDRELTLHYTYVQTAGRTMFCNVPSERVCYESTDAFSPSTHGLQRVSVTRVSK